MNIAHMLSTLMQVGGACMAIAAIGVLVRWFWHRGKTLKYLYDTIMIIRHEVVPNGGGSLKDHVLRIEETQDRQEARYEDLEAKLMEHISHGLREVAKQQEKTETRLADHMTAPPAAPKPRKPTPPRTPPLPFPGQ